MLKKGDLVKVVSLGNSFHLFMQNDEDVKKHLEKEYVVDEVFPSNDSESRVFLKGVDWVWEENDLELVGVEKETKEEESREMKLKDLEVGNVVQIRRGDLQVVGINNEGNLALLDYQGAEASQVLEGSYRENMTFKGSFDSTELALMELVGFDVEKECKAFDIVKVYSKSEDPQPNITNRTLIWERE